MEISLKKAPFYLGLIIRTLGDQPWDFFGRNDAKAETPVLWPPHAKSWLIGKDSDAGRDWGQEEKGTTEDEMAGWHHRPYGRKFEWTLGVGDGLACCDSWGRKESDTTERLNWTELKLYMYNITVHCIYQFSSVAESCPTLRPHGLQHTRLPCPSPTPGACSNSCPSSWWCYPTISSSVIPFSCFHSCPPSGSFPMGQFFASGGQSIGASASASVLPMNIQDWFPLKWTGLISLLSKGLSRVFSNTTVQKHQFFSAQLSLLSNSYIHAWLLEKP